jgi:GNAT superfamily N-acetyltransferase
MIHIEQIRPELTWHVRQRVMYSDKHFSEMKMDEDDDGYHFGVFKDEYLVAVVSLFQNGRDFQFRKFAVDMAVQHTGVGTALLKHITDFAITEGAERLWCNARVEAIGFYMKFDFVHTGKLFSKGGFNYEIMEKIIIADNSTNTTN